MPPAQSIIDIAGLTKRFGEQTVLEGVNLTLEAGRIVGYVGANGSGKTTTFRILTGLLGDFGGEVRVAGHDVRDEPAQVKALIGYAPERALLYETLTLAETLLFFGRLHGVEDNVVQARGEALLAAFDLDAASGRRVQTLSKGMRQKLLLSLALLHDPQVLVLDEPLAGLDPASSLLVRRLLRRLADAGRTIVISSHAVNLVQELCDDIAILHEGRVLACGPFDEIAAQLSARSLESLLSQLANPEGDDTEERLDGILETLGPTLSAAPQPSPATVG